MTPVLTILVAPLLWCGLAFGVRWLFGRNDGAPEDAGEKRFLAILLAPVVTGAGLAIAARFVPLDLPARLPPMPLAAAQAAPSHAAAAPHILPSIDFAAWLVPAVLAIYAAGVIARAVPLVLALARLRRVVNLARLKEVAGEAIYVTTCDVPPLAWGRDMILLPESLTQHLGREALALVIRHEREHLHRGDTQWFAVLAWIDALFWFNPFVRLQTGRCRIAAEIACDAAVTRAAPAMREVYAGLLVETLKHTAGDVRQYAPAVISTCKSGDYRMRLTEIMHAESAARKPKRWLYVALAAAAAPLAFAQFAWSQGHSDAVQNADEPVVALADGTVTKVTYTAADDKMAIVTAHGTKDKTTVDIDYGDGIASEFVTMGQSSFKVGDRVAAGQKLAEDGFPMIVTVQACWQPMPSADKACNVELSALNGRDMGGNVDIMWGDVRAKVRGHLIHADIAFEDGASKTIELDNHLRIDWTPGTDAVR